MANKEQKNRTASNKPKLSMKEKKGARRERRLPSSATVRTARGISPAFPVLLSLRERKGVTLRRDECGSCSSGHA